CRIRILQGHRISIGIISTGSNIDKKLAILGGTGGKCRYHRGIWCSVGYRDTLGMGDYTPCTVGNGSSQSKVAGVTDGDSTSVVAQGTLIRSGIAVLLQHPVYGIAADVLN